MGKEKEKVRNGEEGKGPLILIFERTLPQ